MRRGLTAGDSVSGRQRPVERPHDKVDRTGRIANGSRPLIPGREVVSRNRNELAFRFLPCGHGQPAANRSRSIAIDRKRVVWTRPHLTIPV